MPELEFPPADKPFITAFLARAFAGLTLAKEAQATPLRDLFREFYGNERLEWLEELAPQTIPGPTAGNSNCSIPKNRATKTANQTPPSCKSSCTNVSRLKEHPRICEGKLPVKLWLCSPDGKRLDSTFDWLSFKANAYPKLKPALQKKFPGFLWV